LLQSAQETPLLLELLVLIVTLTVTLVTLN